MKIVRRVCGLYFVYVCVVVVVYLQVKLWAEDMGLGDLASHFITHKVTGKPNHPLIMYRIISHMCVCVRMCMYCVLYVCVFDLQAVYCWI